MAEQSKGALTPEQGKIVLEHMDGIFRTCGLPTLSDTFAPLAAQIPEEQRKAFNDTIYSQVANTIQMASKSYIDAMQASVKSGEAFKNVVSPMGAGDGSANTEHST